MKQTLHRNIERLRMLVVLFVASLSAMTVSALTYTDIDDWFYANILRYGSVRVELFNDPVNPWSWAGASVGDIILPSSSATDTATLIMTYTNVYATELSFIGNVGSGASFECYIDGQLAVTRRGSSKLDYLQIIPAGSHIVEFKGTPEVYDEYKSLSGDYTYIKLVSVWPIKPLETACLKEGSLPLAFENDSSNLWIPEGDYIRTSSFGEDGTTTISTKFTVDSISLFSFEDGSVDGQLSFIINGFEPTLNKAPFWVNGKSYYRTEVALFPGTYDIKFRFTRNENSQDSEGWIEKVCLTRNWEKIDLNEISLLDYLNNLYTIPDLLSISGPIDEADWRDLRNFRAPYFVALDLSGTNITSIPGGEFTNYEYLSTVIFPETLEEIKNNAFAGTNAYNYYIPASVKRIEGTAWEGTPLDRITFAPDSKLTSIGFAAFRNCSNLREFIMPNTVTGFYWSLDEDGEPYSPMFANCTSLETLHLSDQFPFYIPGKLAYNCTSLANLDLPATVDSIGKLAFASTNIESIDLSRVSGFGDQVFQNCSQLKDVKLNTRCWNMPYLFEGCSALNTVLLPVATPPTERGYDPLAMREMDPFQNVDKSSVRLLVPDFALDLYRADPYWSQFTAAQSDDEASLQDYWPLRGNLPLDETHIIRGNSTVEMLEGSVLTIDENTPQHFGRLIYKTHEERPTCFLNKSELASADTVDTYFYIKAKTWYFFSPVCDIKVADIRHSINGTTVFRYYDGARRAAENTSSGNWVNVPYNGTLKRGQGYIVQSEDAGWLKMPVATADKDAFFSTAAVTYTLEDNESDTPANAGWNFVGNPYSTYYDIYYLDYQAPITVWDGSTYRAYSLNDGDRDDDNFVLRPMQPFFVQKASTDINVGMPITGKQTTTAIDRTRAPRRAPAADAPARHKINLEIMRADYEGADDYARVVINDEASLGYETSCDASKFMSLDAQVAQIYTLGDKNHPMAINERPYADGNVKLGVYLPTAGETYVIAARRADRQTWIHDAITGIEHDLTTGDYAFTASKSGHDTARFTLRFAPGATGIESVDAAEIRVEGLTGAIAVTAPAGADVAVYAVDGTVAARFTADETTGTVKLTAGIYLVTVNGETFKTIVK